jgi:hypothetical protein
MAVSKGFSTFRMDSIKASLFNAKFARSLGVRIFNFRTDNLEIYYSRILWRIQEEIKGAVTLAKSSALRSTSLENSLKEPIRSHFQGAEVNSSALQSPLLHSAFTVLASVLTTTLCPTTPHAMERQRKRPSQTTRKIH